MITERNTSKIYYNQMIFCSETSYNKNCESSDILSFADNSWTLKQLKQSKISSDIN